MRGATLSEEEVESLREGNPLMEGVISYVFTKAAAIAQRQDVVHFLDPVVAHAMYAFDDASLGALDEMCRMLVVALPIAEYKGDAYDGVHWSLIILKRRSADVPFEAFRLDSLCDVNATRCLSFLRLLRSCSTCRNHIPQSSTIMDFPSQTNNVDCGCFVSMAALHVAEVVKKWNGGGGGGAARTIFDEQLEFPHQFDASRFRRTLLNEILQERL
ncbi:putative SUMO1/Ulp2 [Trypanosoma rangeli]|uniref:Putative SUMO1/Ulp2 n=1 Tax=Trypanosoma rangeli TaxID=5698 RepID=A0A422NCP1_TRYRA|nr:putative SUMO1/Ulp2 [Trypanosoma rangeli]RNF03243.1 putative SUMO1/Ulp2 [Trypanosoma rangeli]|eukprot:RNF03243.1 putative SUMO1/Ulp2 [Trypanosoma rangeli]